MKKLFLFLLLGLIIPGCIKKKEITYIPNEKLILDLMQDYALALKKENLELLDNFYVHENNLSVFPPGNLIQLSGWSQVKDYWEDFFKNYEIQNFSLDSTSVKVAGRSAWCKGIWVMKLKKGKKKFSWEGRFTIIFENREGKWIAVHEHSSMPRLFLPQ